MKNSFYFEAINQIFERIVDIAINKCQYKNQWHLNIIVSRSESMPNLHFFLYQMTYIAIAALLIGMLNITKFFFNYVIFVCIDIA